MNQIVGYASLLFCDRTNAVSVVTEVGVPKAAADEEAEAVRDAAVALVQRSRPAAAVRATVVEARTAAVARSGQEDTVTVRTGDKLTVHTILRCPRPSAFIEKFLYLI